MLMHLLYHRFFVSQKFTRHFRCRMDYLEEFQNFFLGFLRELLSFLSFFQCICTSFLSIWFSPLRSITCSRGFDVCGMWQNRMHKAQVHCTLMLLGVSVSWYAFECLLLMLRLRRFIFFHLPGARWSAALVSIGKSRVPWRRACLWSLASLLVRSPNSSWSFAYLGNSVTLLWMLVGSWWFACSSASTSCIAKAHTEAHTRARTLTNACTRTKFANKRKFHTEQRNGGLWVI